MATVTADDIRRVAQHVRAASEIIPPYRRREPYDFEAFEPLMKMVPKEPLPYEPRAQRPGETAYEYNKVWRRHHIIWSLQRIDEYFKAKGGRLPSPSSDIDDNEEERAHSALYEQKYVLEGLDIVERHFFRPPMVFEEEEALPPGFWERQLNQIRERERLKLLSRGIDVSQSGNGDIPPSSSSPQGPGRYSEDILRSTEGVAGPAADHQEIDGSVILPSIERSPEIPQSGDETGILLRSTEGVAGLAADQQEMDGSVIYPSIEQSPEIPHSGDETEAPIPSWARDSEKTLTRKRRSLPVENDALEAPSKRPRTDKHPQFSAASNTAGYKRKRDEQEPSDKLSSAYEPRQPREKRRRLDAEQKIQPSQKRKRGFQEDDEELQVSPVGHGVPETKRRRVQTARDASTAAGSRPPFPARPSLRITRARRQQLSGDDARLLQLDQRGKPDVQEPRQAAREPARELPATDRHGRRPRKGASMDAKKPRKSQATNTTKTTKARVKTTTTASTEVNTTKTIAKTRARSASRNTRGKGQLST